MFAVVTRIAECLMSAADATRATNHVS